MRIGDRFLFCSTPHSPSRLVIVLALFAFGGLTRAQEVPPLGETKQAEMESDEQGDAVAPARELDLLELEERVLAAINEGKSPKIPLERMWSMARQDEATATNFLAAMERLAPEFSDPELAWDAQLYMAETAMYLQQYERVDQIYGELLAQDPELQTEAGRSAHYAHAQTLIGRGELERAIEQFRALRDISARYSPEEFQAFGRQLALAYVMAKDWENMAEVSGSVMGDLNDIDDFMFAFAIAEGYRESERYDAAIAIFQRLYNYLGKLEVEDPANRIFEFEHLSRSRIEFRLDWAKSSAEGKKHTGAALEKQGAKAAGDEAAEGTTEHENNPVSPERVTPEATSASAETIAVESPSRWTVSPALWAGIGAVVLVAVGAVVRVLR